MKKHVLCCVLLLAVIWQSCHKTDIEPKPEATTGIIDPLTGLRLDNTGSAGVFQILNAQGQVSGIKDESFENGGVPVFSTNQGSAFQKYRITVLPGNYYSLMNMGSGKYLQAYNYYGLQTVIQNGFNNKDVQQWQIKAVRGNKGKIINKANNLALTVTANGSTILTPFTNSSNQLFSYKLLSGSGAPDDTVANTKAFSVSNVLGSNMVVQRDKPFKIWGKAAAGYKVTTNVTWNNKTFIVTADASGNWLATIPATGANAQPQGIVCSVNGQKAITFTNILIGDLWICAGGANMQMPVDSINSNYEGVTGHKTEIPAANFPNIRLMTEGIGNFQANPQDSLTENTLWRACTAQNVRLHSAVSYFFGSTLHRKLNVPVGLVVASGSDSNCESWTDKATIQANTTLNNYYNKAAQKPFQLYNGMIHPLRNLSAKGFIWYQGEKNRHDNPATNYTLLLSEMIKGWRRVFAQGDLPFYYVQTAPFAEDFFISEPWGGNPAYWDLGVFREAMEKVQHLVPKTGMAFTQDVGEAIRLYPKDKRPVGERLAYLVLNDAYSISTPYKGPRYLSHTVDGRIVTISYVAGTANGLKTKNGKIPNSFQVAGTDKVFRIAPATINGNKMVITAPPNTPLPIQSVRFAFNNIAVSNLINSDGLPAELFRTDSYVGPVRN